MKNENNTLVTIWLLPGAALFQTHFQSCSIKQHRQKMNAFDFPKIEQDR